MICFITSFFAIISIRFIIVSQRALFLSSHKYNITFYVNISHRNSQTWKFNYIQVWIFIHHCRLESNCLENFIFELKLDLHNFSIFHFLTHSLNLCMHAMEVCWRISQAISSVLIFKYTYIFAHIYAVCTCQTIMWRHHMGK